MFCLPHVGADAVSVGAALQDCFLLLFERGLLSQNFCKLHVAGFFVFYIDVYECVLEHLQQNALTSSDLSADSKGCEFSDAHVPSEPAATAGAYGNQYADDRAPEWLPITADCIL